MGYQVNKLTRAFALIGAAVIPTFFYEKAASALNEKADRLEDAVVRMAVDFHAVSDPYLVSYQMKSAEMQEAANEMTPEQLADLKALMEAEIFLRDHDGMVCTYMIRAGDTLSKISQKFGVDLGTLRAPNPRNHNSDLIHTGDILVIPVSHDFVHPDLKPMTALERARPLLDFIGHLESRGQYDLVFGGKKIDFSDKTVAQVLNWQDNVVKKGSPSSAVGKYQFMRYTLRDLIQRGELSPSEYFTNDLQERLGFVLLQRRGYDQYMGGKITEGQFVYRLACEWASLPKDQSNRSRYAGDGLNKALTTYDDVLKVLPDRAPDLARN